LPIKIWDSEKFGAI